MKLQKERGNPKQKYIKKRLSCSFYLKEIKKIKNSHKCRKHQKEML